ncbi:MAG TPA: HAD family hydrolase [Thermoplasmata archaeon]|jgi:D-glycero-D-manno-heptose 1,7-bisphosphate phosphatase
MTGRSKFAVFVDRDGTIVFDKHYLADPDGLELIPTVAEGIAKLNRAGIPVIVVTNQSGVARGRFTEDKLREIHARLERMLKEKGARIDDIFYCPHMPDAGCECRKPAPGMLLRAKERHNIDLANSFVIGDRMLDVEMAHKVGALVALVPEPGDQYHVDDEIRASRDRPDFRTESFSNAADWVLEITKKQKLSDHTSA